MRGVFWIVEGELKAYVFEEGAEYGVAKSGNTFNHKLLWERRPVIYMNPNIGEEYIAEIKIVFVLTDDPVIHYDGSEHYKCYLDR